MKYFSTCHAATTGGGGALSGGLHQAPQGPRQLTAALAGIFLEDLICYDGVGYHVVPRARFRGRYIALLFAASNNAESKKVIYKLHSVIAAMAEKDPLASDTRMECVCVSCDTTEAEFESLSRHVRSPMYAYGDFRNSVMRHHFEIRKCPQLLLIDPDGLVLTANGVASLLSGVEFPWVDPSIRRLWSPNIKGDLGRLLDSLHLPPYNGLPYSDHSVVALLFGELWCPETRQLAQRLEFLVQDLRAHREEVQTGEPEPCAVYFIHGECISNYRLFLDADIRFPVLRIADDNRRSLLRSVLGVTGFPSLCLVSPKMGWSVLDAAKWLKQDPTGVCFPWLPSNVIMNERNPELDVDQQPFMDIVKELLEEDVSKVLTEGPVFIALLNTISWQRAETIAMIRAVAIAMKERVRECARDIDNDPGSLTEMRSLDHVRFDYLMSTQSNPSRSAPWPHPTPETEDKTAYPKVQMLPEEARKSSLNFYYSVSSVGVTQLLTKCCSSDTRIIRQQQLYAAAQAKRDVEAFAARMDMQSRAMELRKKPLDEASSRDSLFGEKTSLKKTLSRSLINDDDTDLEEYVSSVRNLVSHYHPRTASKSHCHITEQLLGDGISSAGSGLIIDWARGAYYVCNNITNKDVVCQFIDAWYDGNLQPFEIGLVNPSEMIHTDGNGVMMQQLMETGLADLDRPMIHEQLRPRTLPCIVVFIPNAAHSYCSMGAGALYRCFLNYAVQMCPAEDYITQEPDEDDLFPVTQAVQPQRLSPMVEKFWIFALDHTGKENQELPGAATQEDYVEHSAEGENDGDGVEMDNGENECAPGPWTSTEDDTDKRYGLTWDAPGVDLLRQFNQLITSFLRRTHDDRYRPSISERETLFQEGLEALRTTKNRGDEKSRCMGNGKLCMRIESSRLALHRAMLDELAYYLIVQSPPPPLTILFVGDLPPADLLPWPEGMEHAAVHVLGNVPDLNEYHNSVAPFMTQQDFSLWFQAGADDKISQSSGRHIAVPWY
eukprot:TRINITY_DN49323_c0_g2_i1.p1 TRINITY_DN49323_c0_g2~~TRINITY_DN49323_c0_g2_i1.p1  ORF type:complete len:1001 (+),score=195.86 TRINITY_DN49323_c0_g2_i1:241-3243(+)